MRMRGQALSSQCVPGPLLMCLPKGRFLVSHCVLDLGWNPNVRIEGHALTS